MLLLYVKVQKGGGSARMRRSSPMQRRCKMSEKFLGRLSKDRKVLRVHCNEETCQNPNVRPYLGVRASRRAPPASWQAVKTAQPCHVLQNAVNQLQYSFSGLTIDTATHPHHPSCAHTKTPLITLSSHAIRAIGMHMVAPAAAPCRRRPWPPPPPPPAAAAAAPVEAVFENVHNGAKFCFWRAGGGEARTGRPAVA